MDFAAPKRKSRFFVGSYFRLIEGYQLLSPNEAGMIAGSVERRFWMSVSRSS